MSNIVNAFTVSLKRDLQIYWQNQSELLSTVLLFVMIVVLLPIAYGPLPSNLAWLGLIMIWIAAVLVSVFAQENLMRSDQQAGILEQILLSSQPFAALYGAKILAHWLVTGLPLVLIAPVLGVSFGLGAPILVILTFSLLLGTPILSLVGSLGATLTLALARGGMLLAILLLPLYLPVLILGISCCLAALNGFACGAHLALLGALGIIAVLFVPFGLHTMLKASLV